MSMTDSWYLKLYKFLFKPPVPETVVIEKVVIKEIPTYIDRVVEVETIKYKVVEVKDRPIQEWDKETRDAVSTLPAHPGFLAVMNRLSLQRQMLNTKLSASYHKELREVDFLQSGLYWLNYIQNTIEQATAVRNKPKQLDAYDEEREAFEKINAAIERVG